MTRLHGGPKDSSGTGRRLGRLQLVGVRKLHQWMLPSITDECAAHSGIHLAPKPCQVLWEQISSAIHFLTERGELICRRLMVGIGCR